MTARLTAAARQARMLARLARNARSDRSVFDDGPLVTVVLSTYNWSSVLRHAVRSVLWQTYGNFELLVIGDGCTDDSEEVVASFKDQRITWLNLPENTGSQWGPNNEGLRLAKGGYIAYQGHDDVWHPGHLASLVPVIERTGADLVYSHAAVLGPPGSGVHALSATQPLEPGGWVPTASVLHRPELSDRIGGWRHPRETLDAIDVDFLRRALLSEARLVPVTALTLFKFPSSWRRNSYREKPDHEQAEYVRRIETEPGFLYRELVKIARWHLAPTWEGLPPGPKAPAEPYPGWQWDYVRKVRGLD
jgi:glycosyltransferase involved in cell wall biosynthesis